MVRIDVSECNGCSNCISACPQQAINLENGMAVINQELCIRCLACVEVCSAGAIRELAPACTQIEEGGVEMDYGRGYGFRGSSPPWPYVGRGRGGLPRCWHPGRREEATAYATSLRTPYWPTPNREGELRTLKDQADVIKQQLESIENRIQELKKEGK